MTQQAQYGREAGGHGLLAKQTRCWSATEGKRNLTEPLKLVAGPSCIGRCERGKLFRKGPVSARGGRAKKPAHLDPQHHGTLLTGQINQRARVSGYARVPTEKSNRDTRRSIALTTAPA